jgi:hypothetical protein
MTEMKFSKKVTDSNYETGSGVCNMIRWNHLSIKTRLITANICRSQKCYIGSQNGKHEYNKI